MVDFSCSTNRTHVQSETEPIVFVAIDLFEDQATVVQPQRLNICLTIDCSGSMHGEKIEQAKQSALILARSLSPNDLISIVSFEGRVKVELGPTPASELDRIEHVINSIRLGSATCLYGGIKQAQKVISQNSQSTVSRIILLTDGVPTDNDNPDDYVSKCNEIIRNGVTVSPIGIGSKYNENLLLQIADSGGGEWMHVTNPNVDLPNFLREQVDDMRATIVVSPQLKFELIPGAEVLEFYSMKPVLTKLELPERKDDQYAILLHDLIKGQDQTIVFKIKLPSQQSGDYTLMNADIVGRKMDIPISYTDDPSLYNVESDANPRILLETALGATLLRQGIDGDTVAMDQATKILDYIALQQPTLALDQSTKAIVSNVQNLEGQTHVAGNLSEEQKKDIKHGTTIIGSKENKV